jgi:phospholipid-binding lipoprotein MlaA
MLALAGCAATGPVTATAEILNDDPMESVNRAIFGANMTVDRAVVRPVAQVYRDAIPAEIRTGVRNVTANLKEPGITANDLLQGNVNRAWTSARRFAVNTTAGVAGAMDLASKWDLPPHSTDFGQTLAVWGIGEGPFVELPALGPSSVRDAVGTAVNMIFDPFALTGVPVLTYIGYGRSAADFLDFRAAHIDDLDELERSAMDFYSSLKSIYRQHRQHEIDEAKRAASNKRSGYASATN